MTLINITAENPEDLFKDPEFPVLPPGDHLFQVANQMEIVQTKGDESKGILPKDMLKIVGRCQDEVEGCKGVQIFDNILIIKDATSDKEITSKKIHEAKLAQFVAACGVKTPEQIKAGESFDIEDCNGAFFNATSVVKNEDIWPQELDELGKPKRAPKASIKRYLVLNQLEK